MSVLIPALSLSYAALLVVAAVSDLMTMKIPNWISLLMLALFPVAAFTAGLDLSAIGFHLLVGFAALVVGFGLFAVGIIGGGDAKFAAAVALWLGPSIVLLEWLIYATLGGAVLTLLLLSVRRFPLPLVLANQGWIARLHDQRTGVPYGIALGAAALLVYPVTEIFKRLAA